jgi:ketosteroid isomerase-like protein
VISSLQPQARGGSEAGSVEDGIAGWVDMYNAGDAPAMLTRLHPQVEFRPLPVGNWESVYRGASGFAEWVARARTTEPGHSLVAEEVNALPGGRVLIVGTVVIASGVREPFCALHEVRDGRIARAHYWLTTPETLRHVGYLD